MRDLKNLGKSWIIGEVENFTDKIDHIKPSDYNEQNRYLPESVTSIPGYIRYSVNPFMREIVDCFDIESPIREVNLKKGVQITYSTVLESGALYFIGHIGTLPMMYITADKELADARIENYFLPMLNQSDMGHLIRSTDVGNPRKSGKTKHHLQFAGGGFLVPFGAVNAKKMRQFSICIMMKDEIDAWPDIVGKDGDPDGLTDDRCAGYWERRKIFRGSTPLIKGTSKIQSAFLNGDQREYLVLCKSCGFPQKLRWETENKETGITGGFKWEIEEGALIHESVCYCCQKCGERHYEHDKEKLFSPEHGAHWKPTAKPKDPYVRSYHLPALYSPIGMAPWYKCVTDYLKGYDPDTKKVIDIGKYQKFYNNILGEPFEIMGSKISFIAVSAHRRSAYGLGQIPNDYAEKHSGSKILFITCQVDVHKRFLAISIMGWCKDSKPYIIEYYHDEIDEKRESYCDALTSPVWGRLRKTIEEKRYKSSDGIEYKILITLIDAGYANDTVTTFCSDYESGVYPILGRDRAARNQKISEFTEFKTQSGTIGYKILVDHYKDRLAPVLRREWVEGEEIQDKYHFNAPVDISDKFLKELTTESKRKKTDEKGVITYYWHRTSDNHLWDLLVYGHAAVEILAWNICIQHFELDNVQWPEFWEYMKEQIN